MKKLIVSVKTTSAFLDEVQKRLVSAEKKNWDANPHFEVSFTEMKDFKKFISNIDILKSIQTIKPNSIYELAIALNKDVGNLNRLISYFENYGVIEVEIMKVNGRTVKKPSVHYKKIEFDLAS